LGVPTTIDVSDMDDGPLLLKTASFALLQTDTPVEEKDTCVVPRHLWQTWVDRQTTEVLLINIQQGNHKYVLCVDSYHNGSQRDLIYVPSHISMELELDDYAEVTVLQEMPPVATKIVLEPLEADTYGFDIAGATSEYLSHWNVLKEGTTLSVPSLEIEGFSYMIHVAKTEPASIVLLRGEVPMDLVELPQEHQRPPTPIPSLLPVLQPQEDNDDFNTLVPLPQPSLQQGKSGFVPFGGPGRRLGS
jgi:hypothetical protein